MAENLSTELKHPPKFIPSSSSSAKIQTDPNPHIPKFPSHLEAPDISPNATIVCEILIRASPDDIESTLSDTGITPSPDLVHEVLELSYNHPASAVKFFRWAGRSQKHSAYAWNLMVDLLGKNQLFDLMWDAIRSMKQEKVLSLPTFVSAFGSYCTAGRFNEAVMSFDVMEKYEIEQNVVAVNSLLSAICQEENQMRKALEFFERIKEKIPPDEDTFAILLEGWEKEGNVVEAKNTLGEMVVRHGWNSQNTSAYDAFLTTLVRGSEVKEAVKYLQLMKRNGSLPSLKFFSNSLDILIKQNDFINALLLWDLMVDSGLVPNLIMYNAMIGLICDNNEINDAFRLLDAMVFHGAFPNSLTYNLIFNCLIKNKKVLEVSKFFLEMVRNECPPLHSNCALAINLLFDGDDPETAIDIWDFMLENGINPIDASANSLLNGLRNLGRLSELRRFVEDMLDRRIRIYDSTMEKMRSAFYKQGRSGRDKYESLYRRWRTF